MRLEAGTDLLHPGGARGTVVRRGLYLDELVRLERAIDLRDDFVGEPLVADEDDGAELVRLGAQLAAAGGSQCGRHAGSIRA
jgi:hypothetical protein